MKTIHSERTSLSRSEWIIDHGMTDMSVKCDDMGEYIVEVVDIDHREAGGIYERKVYLPANIQKHIL